MIGLRRQYYFDVDDDEYNNHLRCYFIFLIICLVLLYLTYYCI